MNGHFVRSGFGGAQNMGLSAIKVRIMSYCRSTALSKCIHHNTRNLPALVRHLSGRNRTHVMALKMMPALRRSGYQRFGSTSSSGAIRRYDPDSPEELRAKQARLLVLQSSLDHANHVAQSASLSRHQMSPYRGSEDMMVAMSIFGRVRNG